MSARFLPETVDFIDAEYRHIMEVKEPDIRRLRQLQRVQKELADEIRRRFVLAQHFGMKK